MSTNPFRRGTRPAAATAAVRASSDALRSEPAQLAAQELTPVRAHYLKTTLVSLQLQEELQKLLQRNALALLGPPFRGATPHQALNELPLLRHFLHRFVLTFPFFAAAPPDFFPMKVQVFLERLLERRILIIDEKDGDISAASTMLRHAERYLCLLISSGIHLTPLKEEVVRICEADRQRLAALDARRCAASAPAHNDTLEVNIVSVRSVVGKGRFRNRTHDEFLLATRASDGSEVHTARRYRDIGKLHVALRARFPHDDIPGPPAKDRSATTMQGTSLLRERNRLTLRAYLRSLLAIPAVADSETMREFLLQDPIRLTPSEERDAAARQHADTLRAEQRAQFARETAERARQLHEHIGSFKADLLEPDGLSRLFATIRHTPHVSQLPPKYRLIVDWAKASMASGLYSMFVGKDTSSQNFAQLKYIHAMVPYMVVRSILRLSNPVAMMRSLLDLFLAQPFGQKSLLQRMCTGQIHEAVQELRELSRRVEMRIGDPHLARKIDEFLTVPYQVQRRYLDEASKERIDIITAVLRSPLGGDLQYPQVQRVVRASRAYAAFKRHRRAALAHGEPEPEPDNDDAWLYEDLHVYKNLASQIRDKEQLISLIYDNATTELLKEIITIFYAPLAQVYKAANIADSLGDVQVFLNDLIRTIEENEDWGTTQPQRMVQVFVDLVQRHEQMFYNFVYQVHSKGSDLFDRLVQWVELFVNYVRDPATTATASGLGLVDLTQCLPKEGSARARVFSEVDHIVRDAYQRKLKRELKTQQRLARQAVARAGEEPEVAMGASGDPVAEVLSEQFGLSGMFGQVADVEAEESGSESESDATLTDSDSDEGPEEAEHFLRHQRLKTEKESVDAPSTHAIRSLLPTFMDLLRPRLATK